MITVKTKVTINFKRKTAVVVYRGKSRRYNLADMEQITPEFLFHFYAGLGYKMVALTSQTIRFEKMSKAALREAAA